MFKDVWIKGTRFGCEIKVGDRVWNKFNRKYGIIQTNGLEDFKWTNDNLFEYDPVLPTVKYEDGSTCRINTSHLWKLYKAKCSLKNLWGLLLKSSYGYGKTYFFNEPELVEYLWKQKT